jgi:hypothetical protein
MPDQSSDGELERLRRELCDLQVAIVQQDPPLDHHTRSIAEGKIRKLQNQIKALVEKRSKV